MNRISYIDVTKGIAMLMVVLGHSTTNIVLSHYLYSFHMMIFFFISGVLINIGKYPKFKDFFNSRVRLLYMPFFVLYIVLFLYWFIVERHMRSIEIPPAHAFLGAFWGSNTNYWLYPAGPLWFVASLFSLELILYPLLKLHQKHKVFSCIGFAVFFLIGVLLIQFANQGAIPLFCLPMGLNNGLIVIPFFVVGFICRRIFLNIGDLISNKVLYFLAFCMLVPSIIGSQYLNVDISYLKVNSWVLYLIVPFFGVFSWLFVGKIINESKALQWIGVNTLPILAFHGPIKRILYFLFERLFALSKTDLKADLLYAIIIFVCTMLCCVPIVVLWNKLYDDILKKRILKNIVHC